MPSLNRGTVALYRLREEVVDVRLPADPAVAIATNIAQHTVRAVAAAAAAATTATATASTAASPGKGVRVGVDPHASRS